MTETMLTNRRKMLEFIGSYEAQHGTPPTIREVALAVTFTSTSVAKYNLECAVRAGVLERRTDAIVTRVFRLPRGAAPQSLSTARALMAVREEVENGELPDAAITRQIVKHLPDNHRAILALLYEWRRGLDVEALQRMSSLAPSTINLICFDLLAFDLIEQLRSARGGDFSYMIAPSVLARVASSAIGLATAEPEAAP